MSSQQVLVYFGHHKCGTVWINRILTNICSALSLNLKYVDSPNQFSRDLPAFIRGNHVDFLTYANADIDFVTPLHNFRGFHVIRDPRDLLVSSYFSHLYSHPTDGWNELADHREKLRQLPKEDGLLLDMDFIERAVFDRLNRWEYTLPNVMEIRMEDLTRDPDSVFSRILEFLGIYSEGGSHLFSRKQVISRRKLKRILQKNSFAVLAEGRKPGEENQKHHFRKGVPGDWVNHFGERAKERFKEKYDDLVVKLGYEKSTNW